MCVCVENFLAAAEETSVDNRTETGKKEKKEKAAIKKEQTLLKMEKKNRERHQRLEETRVEKNQMENDGSLM